MSKWLILIPSSLVRVGLVGVAVMEASAYLLSQGGSVAQRSTSNGTQPFAEFDNSLTKAAESLLVPVIQPPRPAIISTVENKTTPNGLAERDDLGPRIAVDRAQSPAAVRLALLLPAVEPILRNRGVPAELAAVILVESGGRVDALSPKGARGLWQLMPDTARRYGLHVDEIRDDRLDLFKGTDAAARYLHDLYVQFGDWKLALAAYNTGEANVGSAILRGNSQDFYRLSHQNMLPPETRNYVPRVLAVIRSFCKPSVFPEFRDEGGAKPVFASSSR
jgi:hypothetical protein